MPLCRGDSLTDASPKQQQQQQQQRSSQAAKQPSSQGAAAAAAAATAAAARAAAGTAAAAPAAAPSAAAAAAAAATRRGFGEQSDLSGALPVWTAILAQTLTRAATAMWSQWRPYLCLSCGEPVTRTCDECNKGFCDECVAVSPDGSARCGTCVWQGLTKGEFMAHGGFGQARARRCFDAGFCGPSCFARTFRRR